MTVRPNQRSDDLEALGVELEDGAEGQLILVGPQGAQFVTDPLGQHGADAVDQVHAGGAVGGLLVQGTAGLDVVAHVGDVHADLDLAVFQVLDRQGVVEVLGRQRVDGEGGHLAQVAADVDLLGADLGGQGLALAGSRPRGR